jgi:tetratricopeptide (TPR) repeat protein
MLGAIGLVGAAFAKPLPAASTAPTQHDLNEDWVFQLNRIGAFVFRAKGHSHPDWDKDAIRLLKWMADRTIDYRLAMDTGAALKLGERIIYAGCHDPLVFLATGYAHYLLGDYREARKHYHMALARFPDHPYSKLWLGWGAWRLCQAHHAEPNSGNPSQAYSTAFLNLKLAMTNGSFTEEHQRFLYRVVVDDFFTSSNTDMKAEFLMRYKERKLHDPWMAHMMTGILHIKQAWGHRGGGTADTVTQEGWRMFEVELAKAVIELQAAHALYPDRPEAATQMITVAMAGHAPAGTDERHWLDEALKAQFDYLPAYDYYEWTLRPRWGGSLNEMVRFAHECAQTERYDTEVPYRLEVANYDLVEEMGISYGVLVQRPDIYDPLYRMLEGYRGGDHPVTKVRWFASMQVALNGLTGRYADARPIIERFGDKLQSQAFTNMGLRMDYQIGKSLAHSGSFEAATEQAMGLIEQRDYRQAEQRFARMAQQARDEPGVGTYYLEQAWKAKTLRVLNGYGWVDIHPDTSLRGWRPVAGAWHVTEQGELVSNSNGKNTELIFDLDLGDRYEIAGRVEFLQSTHEKNVNAGPILAYTPEGEHVAVQLYRDERNASIRRNYKQIASYEAPVRRTNDFLCRMKDGQLTLVVNKEQVVADFQLPPLESGARVGVGGWYYFNVTTQYTGLRVRKLRPPMPQTPFGEGAPTGLGR